MNAVNLLPERHRPRRTSGSANGSSWFVLGTLGAILVALLVYVLTLNSINSARDQVAQAKADTARFQAQAAELGPYGDFSKIKTQRVDAVKQLAEGRFDWERLVRELSSVLPADVWLTNATAADSPADSASGAAAPGAAGGSAQSDSGANSPEMTLQGCARNQQDVATTLVRLRDLDGAQKVDLDHSTRGDNSSGGSSSSSSGGSGGSCGSTKGQPNYSFQVNVTFNQPTPAPYERGQVPSNLGGGQ